MDKKIVIYETEQCCSGSNCCSSMCTSSAFNDFQDTIDKIQKDGYSVQRYSIVQNVSKFRENPEVVKLIQDKQLEALPITVYNGKIVLVGAYPSYKELQNAL